MHPAYSVILFTTASGAGYGLLAWLSIALLLNQPVPNGIALPIAWALSLVLISTGLLSSTFHLGRPERSWRALSQWRSSWLSREGILALLTFAPALAAGYRLIPGTNYAPWQSTALLLTAGLSIATVACTAMIYQSLTTIPRWSTPRVLPIYLAMAAASGGLLYLALSGLSRPVTLSQVLLVIAVLLLCWYLKTSYWRFIETQVVKSNPGTATGLGHLGQVKQLEAPHTSENYLLKEMGYRVARKHARRLRRLALNLGLVAPAGLLAAAIFTPPLVASLLLWSAALSGLTATVIERWLFFAEARHQVTLFYGREL